MEAAKPGRLAGKTALITGAASGIGRATAKLFHAEGAKVAATDRNEAGLADLKPDVDLVLPQDVTDEERWRQVIDAAVAAFGRLDILVNSAGVARLGSIETATLDDWRLMNAVNVEGTFLGCREAVRAMKETGGGSIVNLSSVAGIIGDAQTIAYCASKGAVIQITRCMALDHAQENIRINSVCPGEIHTRMVDDILAHRAGDAAENLKALAAGIPMRRLASPAEVAWCVHFLASDRASYVTGTNLSVDGGNDATAGPYP